MDLHSICSHYDTIGFKKFIKNNGDINIRSKYDGKRTVLEKFASYVSHHKMFIYIIKSNPRMNIQDNFCGNTTLIWTNYFNFTHKMHYLTKLGTNLFIKNNWGTSVIFAEFCNNVDLELFDIDFIYIDLYLQILI